jgi:voltage-gated potassium channel
VLFILVLTLTLSGALIYMVEGDVQPAVFSSIPASMWWAIETLTTVGYGDMVPQTAFGKMLGGIVSIIGIGTLALFSGLITVSFMNQLRLRRSTRKDRLDADSHALEQYETQTKCPSCGRIVGTAIE